jgi:dUTP pyrophosphatase
VDHLLVVKINSPQPKANSMRIKPIHKAFIMPNKGSIAAGAFDIYMPEGGIANETTQFVGLGFAAEVPPGHLAIMVPRSSAAKTGLELVNTVGYIDSDYRGEWKAALRSKTGQPIFWGAGDRLLQFAIVPIAAVTLELADELDDTERGAGGFGSSGS